MSFNVGAAMPPFPVERTFKISKRSKQCIEFPVTNDEDAIYFSFSTLSGSIQLQVLFAPRVPTDYGKNFALNLTSSSNYSTSTLSTEYDDIRNGLDLECNYFSSTGKYFCFQPVCADAVPSGMEVAAGEGLLELLPVTRYPASKMTIRGKLKLPTTGRCFFLFDNSFSLQKSKHVHLSINQTGHVPCGWLYKKKGSTMHKKYWFVMDAKLNELKAYKKPLYLNNGMNSEVTRFHISLMERAVLDVHKLLLFVHLRDGKTVVFKTKRYSELKFWKECLNEAMQRGLSVENCDIGKLLLADENRNNSYLKASEQSNSQSTLSSPDQEFHNLNDSSSDCESFYDAACATNSVCQIKRMNLPSQMQTINIRIKDLLCKPRGSLPIHFNEPLTLLQKVCEDIEYADSLLSETSLQEHEFESVCAFALSSYASNRFRDRKPFNPLIGETFELQHGNIRYFSEKVSHDPLVIATHTIGDTFEYWNSIKVQSQLKGISIEIGFVGKNYLKIKSTGNLYEWNRASSVIRAISGQKSVEMSGLVTITETTKHQFMAEIKFKSSSFFSKTPNYSIEGTIQERNPAGNLERTLQVSGEWDQEIWITNTKSKLKRVLFKPNTFPLNCRENYGFTEFAMNLNVEGSASHPLEMIPLSDSRNRPDLQMYERGLVDQAQQIKNRIEQKQRENVQRLTCGSARWFELNRSLEWVAKRDARTRQPLYWTVRAQEKIHFIF